VRARASGRKRIHTITPQAVARSAGSALFISLRSWGLRPRLYSAARFAGSALFISLRSWGLRPRLYSAARFAGSAPIPKQAEMDNRVARMLRATRSTHNIGISLEDKLEGELHLPAPLFTYVPPEFAFVVEVGLRR